MPSSRKVDVHAGLDEGGAIMASASCRGQTAHGVPRYLSKTLYVEDGGYRPGFMIEIHSENEWRATTHHSE
jgi:hypothetical protein